jgi:hypothetical protein
MSKPPEEIIACINCSLALLISKPETIAIVSDHYPRTLDFIARSVNCCPKPTYVWLSAVMGFGKTFQVKEYKTAIYRDGKITLEEIRV